jgi:nucleotide-binding universal stress UspA family protein
MAHKVLLCTDGSPEANEALKRSLGIIADDASLLTATVVDVPDISDAIGAGGFAGPTMTAEQVDEQQKIATQAGQSSLAGLKTDIGVNPVSEHVLYGEAGHAICQLVDEQNVDLVVVGSRGRGGLKRALLGSVSDYVVRNAPCPVLVIRNEIAAE